MLFWERLNSPNSDFGKFNFYGPVGSELAKKLATSLFFNIKGELANINYDINDNFRNFCKFVFTIFVKLLI